MKLLHQFFILIILNTYAYSSSIQLECSGDYKINGQVSGHRHTDVTRAGVAILKDYGVDLPGRPGSRYALIVVHDKNTNTWSVPAGKVEQGDRYTSETASRELLEETGGFIQKSSREISQCDYIYNGEKQIFFLKENYNVSDIDRACKAAQTNSNLSSDFKECDRAAALSLPEFLQALKNRQPRADEYNLTSRSNGLAINFEGHYYRIFETKRTQFLTIVNNAFGTNFQ